MFNPFKGQPKKASAAAKPGLERSPGPEQTATAVAVKPAVAKTADKRERRLIGVLSSPHQTEKATAEISRGWYTFRVHADANKITVRRAVEERYGVSVKRVRMLRSRPKSIRLGQIRGQTPGFKKAMVKVRAGQSIEFT